MQTKQNNAKKCGLETAHEVFETFELDIHRLNPTWEFTNDST